MKKEHEEFLDKFNEKVYSLIPPKANDGSTTIKAFKAFYDIPKKPYPFDKITYLQFGKIYQEGFTFLQIFRQLSKTKRDKALKIILSEKPKDRFKHLREADKIFFNPESILNQFNIEMPSGIFKLNLISYLGGNGSVRRKINSDRKLKPFFNHCFGILSSIEDDFFKRFKKEKKNHQRAIDIIFGRTFKSEEGKHVTIESLKQHIEKVRRFLNNGVGPRSGNFYTDSIFYYIANLMKGISDWRCLPKFPDRDESKKRTAKKIYQLLFEYWPTERIEIVEGIYNQLKKTNLKSIPLEKLAYPFL